MKKVMSILIMFVSVVSLYGENIFKDGTIWNVSRVYVGATPDEMTYQNIEYSLADMASDDDAGVFNLIQDQTRDGEKSVVVCRIKEEDSRVYFQQDSYEEWFLMYDFNIKPGEQICVFTPSFDLWVHEVGSIPTYIKCISEDTILTADREWTMLNLEQYVDPDCKRFIGTLSWVKGIGATVGFIENCRIGDLMGLGSFVNEVICDNEVIYSCPYSTVSADVIYIKHISISCDGRTISITGGASNTDVSVLNIDGGKLAQAKSSEDCCSISVDSPGVYIVKVGDMARKVMVK